MSETILTPAISGQITGGLSRERLKGMFSIPRTGKYTHHGNGLYYLTYNHVVELQVVEGQFVSAGDLIGRASPAAIRHGGAAGLNQVDKFEWGLREASSIGATGLYPYEFLPESDQIMLRSVFVDYANARVGTR